MRHSAAGLLLVVLSSFATTDAFGQTAAADSADIYAQQAQALAQRSTTAVRAFPLWLRAADLYRARGDSLGWARALSSASASLQSTGSLPSAPLAMALPHIRQAAAIYLALGKKVEAADVQDPVARSVPSPTWPLDSVLAYRARVLELRRALGDRVAEARLMATEARILTDFAERRDVAQRALAYARQVADPLAQLLALNVLGVTYLSVLRDSTVNVTVRTAWSDSSRLYFIEGAQLAERLGAQNRDSAERELYYREEHNARFNLIGLYQTGPHRDSVVHYAHEVLRFAKRIRDPKREASAEVRLSQLYASRVGLADSARFHALRALTLARSHNDTIALSSTLTSLADIEQSLGFTDSAIVRAREAEQLARATGAQAVISTMVGSLARAHAARGNLDSAILHYRRLLDSTTSVGPNLREVSIIQFAEQLLLKSMLDSAELYFRRAAAGTLNRVPALIGVGRVALARGQIDSATTAFESTLREASAALRGLTLSWMALAAMQRGDVDSSIALRRSSLSAYTAQRNGYGQSVQLSSLAHYFRQRGLLDSALIYYRRSLALEVSSQSRVGEQSKLQALSGVFIDADNADSALTMARAALALATMFDTPSPLATAYNNIGHIYLHIGQYDSARVYLERSLRINADNGNVVGESANLTNLAFLRLRSAPDDSTFMQLRRAIALRSQLTDRTGEVVPRLHLARAFSAIGHHDSSLVYARGSLALATGWSARVLEGRALAQLGRTYAALGARDSARTYFSAAVTALRRQGMTRELRTTLAELAELFRTEGSNEGFARATAYFDSAAAVIDDARRGAGGEDNEIALSETQVDVFGGWARAWVARSDDVGTARSASAALGAVERGRAQSLVSMLTRLQSANRQEALLQSRAPVGSDLSVEADLLLAPLRASRTAALTYLMTSDTLFTWLLTPEGVLELQTPVAIPETEVNRLVRSSRRAFSTDDARSIQLDPDELANDTALIAGDPSDDWRRLAELLQPGDLEEKVPAGTPLVIVPHGSIGLVPFSALSVDPDTARRSRTGVGARRSVATPVAVALGERNPLRYSPSFAALRASESRARVAVTPALRTPAAQRAWRDTRGGASPSATESEQTPSVTTAALVVGNPSMPYVYSGRWTTRSRLQPLPGAEAESRTIAAQLGAAPLTGGAATETAIRQRMTTAPLIHFATHGLAYGTASAARRSFIAFAPDSAQDGMLTLGELMDDRALTLTAELVVLSACQTGLGDMKKAEGSIGLQRAFLAKGARSVLVSLWSVDDTATRLLMEKFYAYWLDPTIVRSKATALQMAQDAVRRTPGYADPKYWAAFQLVGAD